jgi:hypothetical protein
MAETQVATIVIYPSGPSLPRHPYYVDPNHNPKRVLIGDSPNIGGWQKMRLFKDGDNYYVEAQDANVTLSLTPNANSVQGWETRPKGTRASWERLRAQDEADVNGKRHMLYRYEGDKLLGMFEFVEV